MAAGTMIRNVAIIAAGLMGHGLAVVFSQAGFDVAITDPIAAARDRVKDRIAATLQSLGENNASLARITVFDSLAETVANADMVIEAAPEKLDLKQALFADLERHAKPDAILASNTSVIPISQIARALNSRHRVIGTHWWNPPYLVPLVEVIQTADTDAAIVSQVMALLVGLGKVPVHVKKDVPGFVGNRLQHALWREAISLVEQGVCDAETVDLVVKNSFGRRLAVLGPLENADLVGTDLTLDIHRQVLSHLEDSHHPSPFLQSLVARGDLGFKTNRGFRTWSEIQKSTLRQRVAEHLVLLNQILGEDHAV